MDTIKDNLKNLLFSLLTEIINTHFPKLKTLEEEFVKTTNKDSFFQNNSKTTEAIISLQHLMQYTTLKLLLNNIVNSLNTAQQLDKKYDKFILNLGNLSTENLINNLLSLSLEPVLTAHPTEPFSSQTLNTIAKLQIYLEENLTLLDTELIKSFLYELMNNPLTPEFKLSVEDEIKDNIRYFHKLYKTLPVLMDRILTSVPNASSEDIVRLKNHSFLKPRSWTGGDADGNPNITAETMLVAVKAQSKAIFDWYIQTIDNIIALNIADENLSNSILQLKLFLTEHSGNIDNLKTDYEGFKILLEDIFAKHDYILSQHSKIKKALEHFKMQLNTFSFHLALIDTRQNARIYEEVYNQLSNYLKQSITYQEILSNKYIQQNILEDYKQNKFVNNYSLIHMELARIEVIAKLPFIFSNLIISDTQSLTDILNPLALCKIFQATPTIVPLFETVEALNNALHIISSFVESGLYLNPTTNNHIKLMVGYSDSEKEAGIFILPLLKKITLEIEEYFAKHKINHSIFHGNGLDLSRGGPTIFETEQTIQGNQKRYFFNTTNSTLSYFFFTLNSKINNKNDLLLSEIVGRVEPSVSSFRDIFSDENNYISLEQYLSLASPYWLFVKTNNFSSRPSTRKDEDKRESPYLPFLTPGYYPKSKVLEGIRAISQVNTIEGTFTNFNLWYGLEDFLSTISLDKIKYLLSNSFSAYDLITKSLIAIKLADFKAAKDYFPTKIDNKFFLNLDSKYKRLTELINKLDLKLPDIIEDELESRKNEISLVKNFFSFACKNLVYKEEGYTPKYLKEVFSSNLNDKDYLALITNLFGAAYCGFTEYRTPPFNLLCFYFSFYLQGINLDESKSNS